MKFRELLTEAKFIYSDAEQKLKMMDSMTGS